jgi:TPR repeat protein
MPNLIGLGAGASAGALAVALGLAFWPQFEHAAMPGKSVVSQPVFVASAAPVKARADAAAPAAAIAATPVGAVPAVDDDAKAKLAMALQANPPKAPVAASQVGGVVTRSMTLVAPSAAPQGNEGARRLCAQGLVALAAGDIVGARLYLERAADSGDVRAFMVLGETYDPASLARMGVLGIKGDAAKARDYYAKALAAGMGAARERMAALEAP